jgi:AcrR family transcriptional regulator
MTQPRVSTQTLKRQKQARKEIMIEHALQLFLSAGIESTTMNDVANASKSGVASAFRYFETKHHLVVATASLLWEQIAHDIHQSFPSNFKTLSGLEQVTFMLSLFKSFYMQKPTVFRFLEQFDNYVIAHQLDETLLDGYEDKVLFFQPLMLNMIQKGKQDGSIKAELDSQLLYLTMTHQLMSLIAKLVLRGHILRSDDLSLGEAQLDCVIEMIQAYISTPLSNKEAL